MSNLPLILASESPSRLQLMTTCHLAPEHIIPSHIDETPLKRELPKQLAKRLSESKAACVSKSVANGYIVAADSIVVVGRTVLPKAVDDELVRQSLTQLSGRRHRVYTSITVLKKENGTVVASNTQLVCTMIKFKRLTEAEIDTYVASKEGLNKAGGYAIQGLAQIFARFIGGSVANIIGLPTAELYNMLQGLGYDFDERWRGRRGSNPRPST